MKGIDEIAQDYSPEIALAVLMLRVKMGKSTEQELQIYLTNFKIDLPFFLSVLEAHQIESIVYTTGCFNNFNPGDPLILKFKEKIIVRSKVNMIILNELVLLQKLFSQHRLEVIFYKGVMLSKIIFNDLTTRSTSDIDILIKAGDFLTIRNLLLNEGFEEMYFYPESYHQYYLEINRESLFRKKCISGTFIYVEIQWAPLPEIFGHPYNNNYFFERNSTEKILNEIIPIPALNEHMTLLFIHHGIADLWRNLKHIFDISVMADKYSDKINWKVIEGYIEQNRFVKNAIVGKNLIDLFFGIKIPIFSNLEIGKMESEKCMDTVLSFPLLTKKKKSFSNVYRQLLLSDGLKERFILCKGYLKQFVKPSMVDLQNQHFTTTWFPLYYITKRFRFLYKHKKISILLFCSLYVCNY